jgi:endonuclease YncB( thermonuclease family)
MAWHKHYEREQPAADRKAYSDAEDAAKAARRGLWDDAEPVPPWDFRHNK